MDSPTAAVTAISGGRANCSVAGWSSPCTAVPVDRLRASILNALPTCRIPLGRLCGVLIGESDTAKLEAFASPRETVRPPFAEVTADPLDAVMAAAGRLKATKGAVSTTW